MDNEEQFAIRFEESGDGERNTNRKKYKEYFYGLLEKAGFSIEVRGNDYIPLFLERAMQPIASDQKKLNDFLEKIHLAKKVDILDSATFLSEDFVNDEEMKKFISMFTDMNITSIKDSLRHRYRITKEIPTSALMEFFA